MTRVLQSWSQLLTKLTRNKLATNSGIYILGQFLQKAFAFILIPLYTRYLMPGDFGITGTLGAYGAVLSVFMVMGLSGAVSKQYFDHTHDPAELDSYLMSIVAAQLGIAGLLIVLLNLFGPFLWRLCSSDIIHFDPYARLMIWSVYLNGLLQVPFAIYQSEQQAKTYVVLQLLLFLGGVAACLIFVVRLHQGAEGLLISQVLSNAGLVIFVYWIFLRKRLFNPIKWRHIRAGLLFGLPLLPHSLGSMIMYIADRIILERYVTLSEIGLYGMGVNFGMLLAFVGIGINQAWAPYYMKLMKEDPAAERKVVQVVSLYLPIIGAICLFGSLFARDVVHLLLPISYHGSVKYIPPIFLGNLFGGLYYFAGLPLFFKEKTKWFPIVTGATALLDLGLNLWLVPFGGAMVAAWVFAAVNGVLMLTLFLVSRRYDKTPFPIFKYASVLVLIIALTALATRDGIMPLHFRIFIFAAFSLTVYFFMISEQIASLRAPTLEEVNVSEPVINSLK